MSPVELTGCTEMEPTGYHTLLSSTSIGDPLGVYFTH